MALTAPAWQRAVRTLLQDGQDGQDGQEWRADAAATVAALGLDLTPGA